jgi:RNA polymerase sigma-70 factor (ECF subfamily)
MMQHDEAANEVQFKRELEALIPYLRAFSRTLTGNRDYAEDIAQEALVKAWRGRKSFTPGTNMKAWLFTILRNEHLTHHRRNWRQDAWDPDRAELIPDVPEPQRWSAEFSVVARALYALPVEQREALILVGVAGFSYEESAAIADIEVGTVKSRVFRARRRIMAMLDGGEPLPKVKHAPWQLAPEAVLAQLARLPRTSAHLN